MTHCKCCGIHLTAIERDWDSPFCGPCILFAHTGTTHQEAWFQAEVAKGRVMVYDS